jgi:NAD(P)H-dependent FMN reductase
MSFNIAVLYGSVRKARQGIKAARFLVNQLESRGHNVTFIDPMVYVFPMLDKRYSEFEIGKAPEVIEKVAKIFKKADGIVVVSGEYNHGLPPALKNILDHYKDEYFHKPSAIASYSGGPFGGVRAAVHLKAVLGELGMPSIPTTFPVSAVQDSFDEQGNAIEKAYEKRVQGFLDEFEWYVGALKESQSKSVPK